MQCIYLDELCRITDPGCRIGAKEFLSGAKIPIKGMCALKVSPQIDHVIINIFIYG
jgi:hypothetical protein